MGETVDGTEVEATSPRPAPRAVVWVIRLLGIWMVLTTSTLLALALLAGRGYDLRLIPLGDGPGALPTAGRRLVVVAEQGAAPAIRIFDAAGKMVADLDVTRTTCPAEAAEALRVQLEPLWPPHELTTHERSLVLSEVDSLVHPQARITGKPVFRAVIVMGAGLVILWNVLGGLLMVRYREGVRRLVQAVPGSWAVKFVAFCTLLALAEEVITTAMTNQAPRLGVKMGEAYATASANYFDVVWFHSVIMFVPLFIGWAWMLRRWDFHPAVVFLLFGLTGTFAEGGFHPAKIGEIGMWVYVYGLMVYLPVYSLPDAAVRGARRPRWWANPLAVVLPLPFLVLFLPIYVINGRFHPSDVKIHFPPIQGDP